MARAFIQRKRRSRNDSARLNQPTRAVVVGVASDRFATSAQLSSHQQHLQHCLPWLLIGHLRRNDHRQTLPTVSDSCSPTCPTHPNDHHGVLLSHQVGTTGQRSASVCRLCPACCFALTRFTLLTVSSTRSPPFSIAASNFHHHLPESLRRQSSRSRLW